MIQETAWCRLDNYAISDNTVTKLCHCKGVENDVKLFL